MAGRIELITGPMCSGKSKELLMRRDIYNKTMLSRPVLMPPLFGTAGRKLFTHKMHDGQEYTAWRVEDMAATFEETRRNFGEDKRFVIAIDEVQFFPPEVVLIIERAAREWGWTVICAGLDRDFASERWEITSKLADIADCVIRLCARCATCGALAERTQRLHLDGTPARVDEPRVVLSGDGVRYEPRCWRCHVVA